MQIHPTKKKNRRKPRGHVTAVNTLREFFMCLFSVTVVSGSKFYQHKRFAHSLLSVGKFGARPHRQAWYGSQGWVQNLPAKSELHWDQHSHPYTRSLFLSTSLSHTYSTLMKKPQNFIPVSVRHLISQYYALIIRKINADLLKPTF